MSPPVPLAPLAPLALPALSALPTLPDHQPFWSMGPNHHQPNYNYNSTWYRSPPFPTTNYPTPTEWERRTSNILPPSLTHQSPDENAGIPHLPNPGYTWPSMVRPREVPEDDQHEPCIAVACQTLSSLYEFVQSDCWNGHAGNDNQSRNMLQPPTLRESPASDAVFRTTRSATETVSRLLNCTGRSCARDPSKLLLLGSILLKVLTWYEALYQSEIGGPATPSLDSREDARLPPQPYHLNGNTGLSRPFESMKESILAIPLTTPLGIDVVNLSHATETKMKAQVLLWEVQILSHVCQALEHRIQAAESIRGENNLCGQANTYLSRKVGELQRALTAVCTPVPSLG
ncbi:transcriptional regulator family: Fungal Specific TF [Penicillium psychrosexuale]|uniref:transcriptional regulator family: Fungal Specific TF n=1 Tax=Penicillium psychrosexuale TaxID=1002107 RepID=UPI002544FCE1|nr:transcriptional regulator family: Fungal Specific TF [Penicillium psychrosexuale]KAJ5789132.1 transcriptional regulator family: Fungal Specific TF [Penicillium psychrosexuale]